MSGKSALVVDDSKSARFALRKYLEHHAYKVDTAESAEAAYGLLRELSPDLIFLDHIMPGEDGFEALAHLKADPHTGSIPVVICSGNEGEDFIADARKRGAAAVLAKPPTPEHLSLVLDTVSRERERAAEQAAAAAAAAAEVAEREAEAAARLAAEAQAAATAVVERASVTPEAPVTEASSPTSPALADAVVAELRAELVELRAGLASLSTLTAEPPAALADLQTRLQQMEQQVLPRLEQQELALAALRQQVEQGLAEAARQAADRIADALLQALGRAR